MISQGVKSAVKRYCRVPRDFSSVMAPAAKAGHLEVVAVDVRIERVSEAQVFRRDRLGEAICEPGIAGHEFRIAVMLLKRHGERTVDRHEQLRMVVGNFLKNWAAC